MGWEPKRYTVTDEDGAQVTTTEVEWEDYERDKMLALDLHDEAVCDGCGVHTSRMRKDVDFYTFTDAQCPTCAGADMYQRHLAAKDNGHEKTLPDSLDENAKAGVPRPGDGRKVYIKAQTAAEASG
ncbi:MAG: hypothetical protein ACRDPS_01465 [Nocardioides sp.]|uniref:hypothetical protein n=1 Tax=Nocardioides sp. TaxID=35761 RepID=UPI003D6C114B